MLEMSSVAFRQFKPTRKKIVIDFDSIDVRIEASKNKLVNGGVNVVKTKTESDCEEKMEHLKL